MAPKKEDDILRYDRMVERALRGVVREAVKEVIADGGLAGDHHFYITFLTDFPGVKIPDYLRERYPGEMTIVLQYQFYDLEVDEILGVTLSFNNVPERLEVPLQAITIFADPSVNFALQFQPMDDGDELPEDDDAPKGRKKKADDDDAKVDAPRQMGEVISLDQFRKKD